MPKPVTHPHNSPDIKSDREYKNLISECPNVKPFARELILQIILLRRKKDIEINFQSLHQTTVDEIDHICSEFNYRWINSIIDTYIDYGDEKQRYQSLILSQYLCALMALEMEQNSAVEHYLYDANFGDMTSSFNVGSCTKFSNLFNRIDKNIIDEPFHSFWFKKFRPELNRNKTSFKHLAWYNNFGFYHHVTKKIHIPEFLNHRKSENLLIYQNKSVQFINDLLTNNTVKNIIMINTWKAQKFVDRIDDSRVQCYFSKSLPINDLKYDFVWFGDLIESIPEWQSIKLNNRAILAGVDYDNNAHIVDKLTNYWQVPGFRSGFLKLHGDRPFGWIFASRGVVKLDVI